MRLCIRWCQWLAVAVAVTCLTGCGQDGPKRYEISGTVTFQGQPVPEGNISFEPVDGETGGGYAFIRDGKYDTSQEGRGHLGGNHRVQITGFTGQLADPGNPDSGSPALFPPYETTVDLPTRTETKDFEVPASQE